MERDYAYIVKGGIEPQKNDVNWIFWSAELPRRRVRLSATLLPAQDKINAEHRFLNVRWSITWTSGCLHLLSLGIFEPHITLFSPLAIHVRFLVSKSQPRLCPNFQRGPVHQVCSEHTHNTEDTTHKYKFPYFLLCNSWLSNILTQKVKPLYSASSWPEKI